MPLHPIDRMLVDALPPGTLFSVGGRVRDELRLGAVSEPKDFDYVVTGLSFAQIRERLASVGRVDLVGESFAVLKLTLQGQSVDLAPPRRERSTGVGHRAFDIESGPGVSLEEDLGRRDFRMNAIARALPGGTLVDPFAGEADIAARRIDILWPGAFREDPLRMLRAAQFAARFEFSVSEETRKAMREAAPLAASISAERVMDELQKLLSLAAKPSSGLRLLEESGVLAVLLPEVLEGRNVEQNEWHAYDVLDHNLATLDAAPQGDLVLRLASLLHDVGKPRTKDGPHFYRHEQVGGDLTRAILQRFRFSGEVIDEVEALVRNHMYVADPQLSEPALRRFIRRIGASRLERQFSLRTADIIGSGLPKRDGSNERFEERVRSELAKKPPLGVGDLAIGGQEVVAAMRARGLVNDAFRGDKRVGAALALLLEKVTERPEHNERDSLLTLLGEYLASPEPESDSECFT
uniref:Putative Multifunctional CCA protein n=1 Tax=mine drainage metagenome TaxID=410659 RepID=E6Q7G7_9ZZZZ